MEQGRLEADEVVILVPRGYGEKIRVDEVDESEAQSQITVRVSRERASSKVPTLGIIVK
jgi:hypothetical protein